MEIEDRERLQRNWRGRRLLACRLVGDLEQVIDHLGDDDGSQLPLPDGMPAKPTEGVKSELRNSAVNLLRLILLHNDGRVSPDKLNAY